MTLTLDTKALRVEQLTCQLRSTLDNPEYGGDAIDWFIFQFVELEARVAELELLIKNPIVHTDENRKP